MHVVLVEFTAAPGQRDALHARLLAQASDSLSLEPQCHQFDVITDPENPDLFVLYEIYGDAAAFEYHLETKHFLSFAAESEPMIATKTVRRMERSEP